MTKKTEAALKAIGIVLALNVALLALRFISEWVGLKPGIDYRATKAGPERIYIQQLVFLIVGFVYYRYKVKGD